MEYYKSKFLGEKIDELLTKIDETTIDEELSETSTNAISNSAVTKAIQKLPTKTGNYPQMTVGKAENLVGRGESTEEEFLFRPSAGDISIEDGTARITAIKGNTLVHNQLAYNIDRTIITNDNHQVSCKDRIYTINGISTNSYHTIEFGEFLGNIPNHEYLFELEIVGGEIVSTGKVYLYFFNRAKNYEIKNGKAVGFYTNTQSGSGKYYGLRSDDVPLEVNNLQLKLRQVDLTQMFGINNEPTTIEDFYARKPIVADEFAYNKGELVSMNVEAIKSVGENAFNDSVGYAKILGNKTYNFEGTYTKIEFATTLNGSRESITLDSENKYTFESDGYVFAEGTDICINIQHSYNKDITHEYEENVLDLSFLSDKFPNGMRSIPPQRNAQGIIINGTNIYDEVRCNQTTKNCTKITRIGVVNLGDLSWSYRQVDANYKYGFFYASISSKKKGDKNVLSSNGYTYSSTFNTDKSLFGNSAANNIYVVDSAYTDVTTFKNAMTEQGVKLYYELATPTEETIDINVNLDYLIWDYGTEQAIVSVPSAPFRADIIYQFNAVDRIRNNSDRITELESQIASLMQTINTMQNVNVEE